MYDCWDRRKKKKVRGKKGLNRKVTKKFEEHGQMACLETTDSLKARNLQKLC